MLLDEVMSALGPAPGGVFVDGTVGAGGHAAEILKRIGDDGMLVAFDWDEAAVRPARDRLSSHPNILFFRENFTEIAEAVTGLGLSGRVNGILLDLGMSSMQLADPKRGFSFNGGLLDMRMDDRLAASAADFLNRLNVRELEDLLRRYGEEPEARRLARAIVEAQRKRPIRTAEELASVVSSAMKRKTHLHPATLVFQALRIAVNKELENLQDVLATAPEVLAPGGRFAVISFHSLEDRIVKNAFRNLVRREKTFHGLTRKPITASREEVARNPRARSAKMRAIARLEP